MVGIIAYLLFQCCPYYALFEHASYCWCCVFSATVYQLQQEAPHPRRLTCTCEVRTHFLMVMFCGI